MVCIIEMTGERQEVMGHAIETGHLMGVGMIDFFTFSNELLCEANTAGYFTRVNPAWTATLGWSAEELMSRPYVEFVHPDDRVATHRKAELLAAGNHDTNQFENRYRCRDGTYRWLAWMSVTVPRTGEIVATARDVTVEKLQAEALRVSEERLRLVMDVTSNAIWDFDPLANTIWWNDAYDRKFGPQPPSLADRRSWWSVHIHPEDRERVRLSFRQAIESGADRWTSEYRYQRVDGSYAFVLDRALLARDACQRLTRVLGALQDVTSQKESELRLRERELTIRSMFELQERERRLVSHDIHDGLAQTIFGALMNIEATRAQLEDDEGSGLDLALELMRKAVRECRRLINDLRPMVIEESGIEESIRHLIANSLGMFVCSFKFDCELESARFEPLFEGAVFRIIQEAVSNAIRHGQATCVSISLRQKDCDLEIQVDDDGVGFDSDQVPPDRFGVRGIQERARLFHGAANFSHLPSRGTRVSVHLVIPDQPA